MAFSSESVLQMYFFFPKHFFGGAVLQRLKTLIFVFLFWISFLSIVSIQSLLSNFSHDECTENLPPSVLTLAYYSSALKENISQMRTSCLVWYEGLLIPTFFILKCGKLENSKPGSIRLLCSASSDFTVKGSENVFSFKLTVLTCVRIGNRLYKTYIRLLIHACTKQR